MSDLYPDETEAVYHEDEPWPDADDSDPEYQAWLSEAVAGLEAEIARHGGISTSPVIW